MRLDRLPSLRLGNGMRVHFARRPGARLAGLALLPELPADRALVFPRCRSVHTFGMRFPIDVAFLGLEAGPIRVVEAVPPGRILYCRRAEAVLETPAGHAWRVLHALRPALRQGRPA